jgi:glycine hydroxymethyltransferase
VVDLARRHQAGEVRHVHQQLRAGLVAGGAHASPFPQADVVTTTTYKSLRGPRGAIVLWNDEALTKPINNAVFPGLQGTPFLHIVAAKAVALGEALQPEFAAYAAAVLHNARTLAAQLQQHGFDLVGGGTDTPLMLVDLRATGLVGEPAARSLERAGLIANANPIPADAADLKVMSGLRFGVSGATTRGFGEAEFVQIGSWIAEVLNAMRAAGQADEAVEQSVMARVKALTQAFPIYAATGAV